MNSPDIPPVTASGDFLDLLRRHGWRWPAVPGTADMRGLTHGTTVLAFHFQEGVIVAGDRRATAGNAIMHERCDKVIPIDDYSLMAIAGVPATAFEMARVLAHNFEYFRRSQLQPLSAEGKVRALSRLLKENVGLALQGVGMVSPIFALFDAQAGKAAIYFYDLMGAQFQIQTHTATGSGSPIIRGILEHENLWGKKPLAGFSRREAATLAIRLLHTAALFDSATGQAKPEDKIYPIIAVITAAGHEFMPETEMTALYRAAMQRENHV
jgi:proteasome beta subunit